MMLNNLPEKKMGTRAYGLGRQILRKNNPHYHALLDDRQ